MTDRMTNEDAADNLSIAVRDRAVLLTLGRRENRWIDAGKAETLDGRREVFVKGLGDEYQYVN